MFDVLPRLSLLRQAGFAWDGVQHFLVGEFGARFQAESLATLGIASNRCVPCGPSAHFRCADLLVPSPPGSPGNPPAWVCDFLREVFLAGIDAPPLLGRGRKIYVSRAGARFRRVLNEDEVIRALAGKSFEVVRLEDLTVREQARLFAEADVVVAPHGAGCTNAVFCRPGTAFIEIFAPRYVMACYWAVSSHRKLRYAYALGRNKASGTDGHYFTMIEDIDVDCEKLLQTVDLCISLPFDAAAGNGIVRSR
ncbi:MAG: glycosyltransferase family 61 protein [Chthoniobacteraceae bacterium]